MQKEFRVMSNEKIAEWMFNQFKDGWLYQEDVAWELEKKFGDDAIYENENGNYAINKSVLKAFKKITEAKVVWERGDKAWRILSDDEEYTGRQQD